MIDFTAAQLRSYLRRGEEALRTNQGRAFACGATRRIALEINDAKVVALAEILEAARPPSHLAAIQPDARDSDFDALVEAFIAEAHKVLDEREEQEARVAMNAHLLRAECRERVLAYLARDRDSHWAHVIAEELALSYDQTLDALEQLELENAIEGPKSTPLDGSVSWLARLNAHGRNLADGTARHSMPPVVFHQTFHNSQIANAGVTHGDIAQNVTINPDVADIVYALQQLQEAADADPKAGAIALLAREAKEELQSNGWSAKAGTLLSGIGGLVQTAAALKPAYNTLQPIAVAHNIPLPVWS